MAHLLLKGSLVNGQRGGTLCSLASWEAKDRVFKKQSFFCTEQLAIFGRVVSNTLSFKNKKRNRIPNTGVPIRRTVLSPLERLLMLGMLRRIFGLTLCFSYSLMEYFWYGKYSYLTGFSVAWRTCSEGIFFFCALYHEVCKRGKNWSRTVLLQILWNIVLFCKQHDVANYAVSNVQGDLYVSPCSSEQLFPFLVWFLSFIEVYFPLLSLGPC